jgi:N-carbamoylputrescine amidase
MTETIKATRTLKAATLQFAMTPNSAENIATGIRMVTEAAKQGAELILLPELFALPYFCKTQKPAYLAEAHSYENNPILQTFSQLAAKLKVVLPVSFFERAGQCYFNSLAMIDADGEILDVYRKSHIPDGPGYQEKFYFSPGDTGFKVWETQVGCIGTAICWDQWFPEAARIMTLMGAEILCYPTAIGSEPQDVSVDSKPHWQLTMQGHSAANMIPLVVSNRIGKECDDGTCIDFYGSSFMTDHRGQIITESSRNEETIQYAEWDLNAVANARHAWGLFRDRRPELYADILSF